MDDRHFRALARMYHAAPCNRLIAPVMTIREGAG